MLYNRKEYESYNNSTIINSSNVGLSQYQRSLNRQCGYQLNWIKWNELQCPETTTRPTTNTSSPESLPFHYFFKNPKLSALHWLTINIRSRHPGVPLSQTLTVEYTKLFLVKSIILGYIISCGLLLKLHGFCFCIPAAIGKVESNSVKVWFSGISLGLHVCRILIIIWIRPTWVIDNVESNLLNADKLQVKIVLIDLACLL